MSSFSAVGELSGGADVREARTTSPENPVPALPRFARGEGPWLITETGERFFDATSGSGAVSLGHQHPEVVEAVIAQVRTLAHTGCKLISERRFQMIEALGRTSPYERCRIIPAVTGAEAVEVALKAARAATGRRTVLSFERSFHGKTTGALSVTWRRELARFSPLPEAAAVQAPYPAGAKEQENEEQACLRALSDRLGDAERRGAPIAAALFEPVQATEGMYPGRASFLARAVELVRAAGALVVFDEIYTGLGRAGARYYCEALGIVPDLMIVGKSLGNGVPISAVVGTPEVVDAIPEGVQTSTFSGNPVGSAAALAVLRVFEREQLPVRATGIGTAISERLRARVGSGVSAVRQAGALIGFDLALPSGELSPERARVFAVEAARRRLIVFTGGASGATVKVVPPLLLEQGEIDFLITTLEEVIGHVCN